MHVYYEKKQLFDKIIVRNSYKLKGSTHAYLKIRDKS